MTTQVTRCPACATAFKVTDEQLAVRNGRVRCGQCRHVFDATAFLEGAAIADAPEDLLETARASMDAPREDADTAIPQAAEGDAQSESAVQPPVEARAELAAELITEVPASELAEQRTPEPSVEPAVDSTEGPVVEVTVEAGEAPTIEPTVEPAPFIAAATHEEPPAISEAFSPRTDAPPLDIAPAKVGVRRPFQASPDPMARVERAPRTRWWGLLAGLLLVGLNLQALFYFRGAIALVWPSSKPFIETLCLQLGCDVPLPKRAEMMSIETSDLQAEPSSPGVMVLSATVRNRAAFPQAYPALELTLTNERDQPLARRVFRPAEYLRQRADDGIPTCTGGVASCEVQVRLFLEAAALKASGYRLYLFYP